ncbi:hypothetical protein OB905_05675 [Halobacteria archaeon AArc-dxtr1]|nr:hypothetical protein [Halobacteria archaeon AArc-dxtr1]
MAFRVDEPATDFDVVDRFDGGVSWIAHPDEHMQRASHALVVDGDVWVIDPVDAAGLDDFLADLGTVAGVVVTLDRHKRDSAAIANRHDVPVWLHASFDGVTDEIDAPVARFDDELPGSGIEAHVLRDSRFWQEVALYDPETRTLVVPESVGTADYFLAGDERLGVHPMLRPVPPRKHLGGFRPDRILVGHGAGIDDEATAALEIALASSRRRMPSLYAGALRDLIRSKT